MTDWVLMNFFLLLLLFEMLHGTRVIHEACVG